MIVVCAGLPAGWTDPHPGSVSMKQFATLFPGHGKAITRGVYGVNMNHASFINPFHLRAGQAGSLEFIFGGARP